MSYLIAEENSSALMARLHVYEFLPKDDTINKLLDIQKQHNLSIACIERLTHFIDAILPGSHSFPTKRYKLQKELAFGDICLKKHRFCKHQVKYLSLLVGENFFLFRMDF